MQFTAPCCAQYTRDSRLCGTSRVNAVMDYVYRKNAITVRIDLTGIIALIKTSVNVQNM